MPLNIDYYSHIWMVKVEICWLCTETSQFCFVAGQTQDFFFFFSTRD